MIVDYDKIYTIKASGRVNNEMLLFYYHIGNVVSQMGPTAK